MSLISLVVTCADGLEPLLIDELVRLGAVNPRVLHGAVAVEGEPELGYRVCLWSRLASRVLLPLFAIDDPSPEALYNQAVAHDWTSEFDVRKTFAVHAVASRGVTAHTGYMALKLKDAVADAFRAATGVRPNVRAQEPDIALHVFIEPERLTVSLDLSGESLHRRGYRYMIGEAPLKETLAAAILQQAGWPDASFGALVDPMCGSGTFLTEAALMVGDIAPGLMRNHYGFLAWKRHQPEVWSGLLDEARARQAAAALKPWPRLIGFDASRDALQAAMKNAHTAGLADRIELECRELWKLPAAPAAHGLLVTNPPYGERIGDSDSTLWQYRALGRLARERLPGWQAAVLAADIRHADALGFRHRQTQRLRNGDLTVFVRHGDVLPIAADAPATYTSHVTEIPPEGEAFANRLQKNLAHANRQAKREDVCCYRVYDADLPDFNLAIDVYGDQLHVQEYAAPKEIAPEKASARFRLALSIIRQVFGVHKESVSIKVRAQQKGASQYEKQGDRGRFLEVREGRARLLVNLTDYLDTGLFLDHRPMRARITAESQGKSVLNLFAYTGSVSVAAAMGGARQVTSVDLSGTYLDWAKRNFAVNGIPVGNHRFEAADVMEWLRHSDETFDLIFVDPPTFSNSKKMRDVFDVQRDHVELLTLVMRHLKPDGTCYFSNNFRRFELDAQALSAFRCEDISPATIGFDFKRNERIHRCWKLGHTEDSLRLIVKPGARPFRPRPVEEASPRDYPERQERRPSRRDFAEDSDRREPQADRSGREREEGRRTDRPARTREEASFRPYRDRDADSRRPDGPSRPRREPGSAPRRDDGRSAYPRRDNAPDSPPRPADGRRPDGPRREWTERPRAGEGRPPRPESNRPYESRRDHTSRLEGDRRFDPAGNDRSPRPRRPEDDRPGGDAPRTPRNSRPRREEGEDV